MSKLNRRDFLSSTINTGIGALALSAFPSSIQKALAIPANNRTGTIKDVEHVVILMQENRSFDHYFGTLKGVRGFGDRFTIPQTDKRTVWEQVTNNDYILTPYHLNGDKGNAQRHWGTHHTWVDSQKAWENGRINYWPYYKTNYSMGYFKEKEIPFHFALANAFTLCDAYHCSMHTGTDANRSFFLTGTNGAVPQNRAFVNNEWDAIDGNAKNTDIGYTWTTYAERLEQAKVNWISYQNMPDEWGDNMLGAFRTFKKANIASGYPVSSGKYPNSPIHTTEQKLPYKAYDPKTDNANNPLYKGIANTLPGDAPEDYLKAFAQDVREGRLPQVSWINAPSIYCEHPDPSSPVQGAWFIQGILDALTAVPEVWSKTVFLINYDENDGYFDHMPSPSAPSYLQNSKTYAGKSTLSEQDMSYEYFTHRAPEGSSNQPSPDGGVYGPGPRVPMFIISPWSRGGIVNSEVFDHTSVLMFLEKRFGVIEPNISPFRRAVCGDLTSAFNFKNPNDDFLPQLEGRRDRASADKLSYDQSRLYSVAIPWDRKLPVQQGGIRISKALPYELHTSARCLNNGSVELIFANTGQKAAVFHVYNQLDLKAIPRRYMVEPNKQLEDIWTNKDKNSGEYDLWVLGPNGFHRHFKGNTKQLSALNIQPEIRVCYDVANGNVHLEMMNKGQNAVEFKIKPLAYRTDAEIKFTIQANQTVSHHWDLHESWHWYDFAVTNSQDSSFYRRFAGRVETGKDSVSDPAVV